MPFPPVERVFYKKNPLVEVICQVRFPSILRIDSELPSEFQERIRDKYPLFEEKKISDADFFLPPEMTKVFQPDFPIKQNRAAYDFYSEDKIWNVSLTREFLALSTKDYIQWADFKAHFAAPLEALKEVYKPSFFTRVGLRYKDLIVRKSLGLENIEWSRLLKPHIAAELSSEVEKNVIQSMHDTQIQLNERDGQVRIRHGLVHVKIDATNEDIGYLIDSDFFSEQRTEVNSVNDTLDYFNRQSGRLFQWCIKEELHRAMEPGPAK